jgi:excisionase family DNA binding protein
MKEVSQPQSRGRLLTYAQVGERWGVCKRTVVRLVEAGELEVIDIGLRAPRIPEDAAAKYEAARIRRRAGA